MYVPGSYYSLTTKADWHCEVVYIVNACFFWGGGGGEGLSFVSCAFPVLRMRPMLFRAGGGRERRPNCKLKEAVKGPGLAAGQPAILEQMLLHKGF